jgi:type I restriction-modification system DNA methylase subunit
MDDTVEVARWKGFKVIAVSANDMSDTVRRLAAGFARDSQRSFAVALTPDRVLSLAAPRLGEPGASRVLKVHLEMPSAFSVEQLERLRPRRGSNALSHALMVAEVLSSEQVGERFFAAFRRVFERMAASLNTRQREEDRRLGALLTLTRMLFLYFVQEKGWLDNDTRYIRRLFDTALHRRQHFHRSVLNPLFFGTLNRPPGKRKRQANFGQVPYLNGGLFQPHRSEMPVGSISFSNNQWRDAFDNLFERFRFCVKEAEEVDAIAPDMLGRVFERLMDDAERHQSGSFYTPETVVHQLVEATIETALASRLPVRVARRLVARKPVPKTHTDTALAALRDLRILDPAVGSGAFLLSALATLTDMFCSLETGQRRDIRLRVRRRILKENLCGVDINPIAVRIAELRLWLAVVAEDPARQIHEVAPLPNLDGVTRQGDTLLDPLAAVRQFCPNSRVVWNEVADAVRTARRSLFDARGRAKPRAVRQLRSAETLLARQLTDGAQKHVRHEIKELQDAADTPDLFGRRTGLSGGQREHLAQLRRTQGDLTGLAKQVANGQLPFFSFDVHSPDVMADGGFSVVIGNPPWVRAERLQRAQRRLLSERFSWWRASGTRGYAHQPDLSVAFLQRSLELTAPGGAVGFLLPSKVATAAYGETARRGLVRESRIAYVHRVSEKAAARFGATTYPIGIVVRKEIPQPEHSVSLGFGGSESVPQAALDRPGPWMLLPHEVQSALEEFRSSGTPLDQVARPALGVKTGADRVFVGDVLRVHKNCAIVQFGDQRVPVEIEVLRPALRGRDIRPFSSTPSKILVWSHGVDGAPLPTIPPNVRRYLDCHAHRLMARADFKGGPLWTVFRTKSAVASNRVVWADMARRPRAVALDETDARDSVPLNTCYVAALPDRENALALAVVMNSSWAAALTHAIGDEARGGYRRINARVAGQIPLPASARARAALADMSLEAHQRSVCQDDLDEAVADALCLSSRIRRALRDVAANQG